MTIRDMIEKKIAEGFAKIVEDTRAKQSISIGSQGADKYYIEVRNGYGYTAYLYPDLSIRGKVEYPSGFNGYHTSYKDAMTTVQRYAKGGIERQQMGQGIDSQLRSIIDNALAHFTTNDKMFTAFDVTNWIRQTNPGLHVFHSVVKEYVHDKYEREDPVFDSKNYDRTLIQIASPAPWCYYVPGIHDPNTYAANPLAPVANPQPAAVQTPPPPAFKQGPGSGMKRGTHLTVATFGGIRGGQS